MEKVLSDILGAQYGLGDVSLSFLRESGGTTYIAEGDQKYLVKISGPAFAATVSQSVPVMRYLDTCGFPVPETLLTRTGKSVCHAPIDGEERLLVVQRFVEGDEPDLKKRAADVGRLTARLHILLDRYPGELVPHGKQFFIGRYIEQLRRKDYPRLSEYIELGEKLWRKVGSLPEGTCHGDLHRGNLIEAADGRIYFLDFDTVCRAPEMFDVSVMCDMTDYFQLKREDIDDTRAVYGQFLSGYCEQHPLSPGERRSFHDWVAVRHFQLQATILEMYGPDCIDTLFIDRQLSWLEQWISIAGEFENL